MKWTSTAAVIVASRKIAAAMISASRMALEATGAAPEGPNGRAKIHSDDPKHALGLVHYLRTIGYTAWIEDANGKEIDEKAIKMAIRFRHEEAPSY